MATYFGEVILPSSRAFFDDCDYDDEDELEEAYKQRLMLNTLIPEDINDYDALIIADGPVVSEFVKHYMLRNEDNLLAEIEIIEDNTKESTDILVLNPKKVEKTKLYSLSNKCLLLQVSSTVTLGLSNEMALMLTPWLKKCKRVIILVSRHVSNYCCESVNELPPAFLRALATSSQLLPQTLKHLEQPNFISKVPASVLGWCEAQGKSGIMMILYSDQEILDTLTVNPLLEAFTKAGLSSYLLNQPSSMSFSDPLRNMDKTFMYM